MNGPRLSICVAVTLLSISMLRGWAQERYVPKADEELYGTWTNERYTGIASYQSQKCVVTADAYQCYAKLSDSLPQEEGTAQIDSKWTDAAGNIWYRAFGTIRTGWWMGYKFQMLIELTKSATVWESTWVLLSPGEGFDPARYPTEMNPRIWSHNIRHRAAE